MASRKAHLAAALGTKGFPKHYGYDERDLLRDTAALLEQQYGPLPPQLKTFISVGA